jgi:hypothetical protein
MEELSTFGAILSFAIALEKDANAYYERAAAAHPEVANLAALALAHKKRQRVAEQIRREQVTEMILEPIYGLTADDWRVDLGGEGWAQARELERKVRGFYAAAAAKLSIPQVARMFRKLADESARLEDLAASLP